MTFTLPDHLLMLFIDGLGIGEKNDRSNPCTRSAVFFRHFLHETFPKKTSWGRVAALDATLGMPGLPQSATGQTALLTGVNASALIGRHLNGFPNAALRQVILDRSVLKQAVQRGLKAAFLNAFRPPFFDYNPFDIIAHLSVTSVANLAAGLPFFDLEDLKAGRAVYQDLTGDALREKGFDAPTFTPEEAGRIIGRRSQEYHFALFEYFQTDKAGHEQDMEHAAFILQRLEHFVEAVLENVDRRHTLILLTSDHGNIENLSQRGHTRNPAMTLIIGAGGERVHLRSILDVYPLLLSHFEALKPARSDEQPSAS